MTHAAPVRRPVALAAAALLGLEAAGLLVLAIVQVFDLFAGDAAMVPSAIALIFMTLAAVAAVAAFAVGVPRGLTWARSGGVVAQVLLFAIAVGSVTGGAGHWGIAAALAIPAVAGFALVILSTRPGSSEQRG
ncbi:hypothetical protein [Microbacterium indicum]|uniref:hypothetical protein n=1 Tax=Microbacterium indicum TaxID=358100 RepID=UPI0004221489|nr:hypothetical protein [Microbacterium indicum]